MSLLSPIWLFALAALSIPVIIHLWNIKPGKTLKVGSIALFSESSPKSSRSFKLQDILLLAMRCLMLALLAFLLAMPYLQRQLNDIKAKGWVLIPEANLTQTYKHFQPQIDSLTKAEYEFHYFNSGFKSDDLTEILKVVSNSSHDSLNYWNLIRQLDKRVPESLPIALFTPDNALHFKGAKPQTQINTNWHTYTPADSVSTRIAAAWLTTNGDIRVMQENSSSTGINYKYNNIRNGDPANVVNIGVENGIPVVSLKKEAEEKVTVDTSAKQVAIYADRNSVDANYLKSALEAIGQLTQQKTIIKECSQASTIPAGQDWLFWLSDKPAPTGLARNLFKYESGKAVDINSQLLNERNFNVAQSQQNIPLYKIIKSKPGDDIIWSDGFGDAILSLETNKANTYHFYSRLNPTWSDLVWGDEFPKWLLELTNNLSMKPTFDKRAISLEQIKPTRIGAKNESIAPQTQQVSLVKYLWIALALAFFIERWLATKNNNVVANG